MKPNASSPQSYSFDKLFLDKTNPRHDPYQSEKDVIEYLCNNELIVPLAKDIRANGLNPVDVLAIIPNRGTDTYTIIEGNRRLCALKLLNDPALSPIKHRSDLIKLSKGWEGIISLSCVEFPNRNSAKKWLNRIHGGLQAGIGRKSWNAEQKTRFTDSQKNKPAQAFLDYAVKRGFLSEEERKKKITTVTRFLSNKIFRDYLGIDSRNPEEICRTRPEEDFDLIAQKFTKDLIEGVNVTSRHSKAQIEDYTKSIEGSSQLDNRKIPPVPIATKSKNTTENNQKEDTSNTKPKRPKKRNKIGDKHNVTDKLEQLDNQKLKFLYHSICSVNLTPHSPLICIGAWAFLESLTAQLGRNLNTDFAAYLKPKAKNVYDKRDYTAINAAIDRISLNGNVTKHHSESAIFDGQQLANDIDILGEFIIKFIDDYLEKQ
jgi:hypothetical protein